MREKNHVVRVTCPAPRRIWQDIVETNRSIQIFQTPAWTDSMVMGEGLQDVSRLYEMTDGRKLVMPMGKRRFLLGLLTEEASLPRSWENGGLIGAEPIQQEDIEAIMAKVRKQGLLTSLTVEPDHASAQLWETVRPLSGLTKLTHVTHILDLEGGFGHVWDKRFKGSVRRNVRKAERSGLSIECDTTGMLIPTYYGLYEKWTARRAKERRIPRALATWVGRRRDPIARLRTMAETLRNSFRVWVARLDGEPVAAAIQLVHGIHAHYWRGISDLHLTRITRANDLLQRAMIEDACASGCLYYHMGESGGVESLIRYKAGYGAVPHTSYEYISERIPFIKTREKLKAWILSPGNRQAQRSEVS